MRGLSFQWAEAGEDEERCTPDRIVDPAEDSGVGALLVEVLGDARHGAHPRRVTVTPVERARGNGLPATIQSYHFEKNATQMPDPGRLR